MNKENVLRELAKIEQSLVWASRHFEKLSESNAALHQSDKVMYSPLATSVFAALKSIDVIKNEL